MTVELQVDDAADRRRPNVSGDLPTVLDSAPMFRRAVLGYDRFQVDTYVQWAEDELAGADRERRRLEARHLATRAALDEAEQLLAHSASGGKFLQVSRRVGTMLAAAADEAESMRAAAEADRAAASDSATRMAEHAERLLAAAGAEAGRTVLAATAEAQALAAQARRTVADAERALADAATEVAARLEAVRAVEQRAAGAAAAVARQAEADAQDARLRARAEIVAMLADGRAERRRADAEAGAARARLDAQAADRRAYLSGEVARLEGLRTALQAEVELLAAAAAGRSRRRLDARLRQGVETLRWRTRSLRAP
jgi:cell division septum initiation protein DivIVA